MEIKEDAHNSGQIVDLSFEEHISVIPDKTSAAPAKLKPPAKPRVQAAKKASTAKPKKSKIETEFEKLPLKEQLMFLNNKVPMLADLEEKLAEEEKTMHEEGRGSELKASSTNVPTRDGNLCSLRLELGSVLASEAELRTKEKKLRLAIKREQRRLIMAQSPIVCRTKERAPTTEVVRLIFANGEVEQLRQDQQQQAGIMPPHIGPPLGAGNRLWSLAQQSSSFEHEISGRLLDEERDASLPVTVDGAEVGTVVGASAEAFEAVDEYSSRSVCVPESEISVRPPDERTTQLEACLTVGITSSGAPEVHPLRRLALQDTSTEDPAADPMAPVVDGCPEGALPPETFAEVHAVAVYDAVGQSTSAHGRATADGSDAGVADSMSLSCAMGCTVQGSETVIAAGAPQPGVLEQAPTISLFRQFAYAEDSAVLQSAAPTRTNESLVDLMNSSSEADAHALPRISLPTCAGSCVLVDLTTPDDAPSQEAVQPPAPGRAQMAAVTTAAYREATGKLPPTDSADRPHATLSQRSWSQSSQAGVIHYIPEDEELEEDTACRCSQETRSPKPSAAQAVGTCHPCPEARDGGNSGSHTPAKRAHSPQKRVTGTKKRKGALEDSQTSSSSAHSDSSNVLNSAQQPDFAAMPVQKLRDIVQHYGLKPDTKGKMVSLLRCMWQRLHQEGETKKTAVSTVRYAQAVGAIPVVPTGQRSGTTSVGTEPHQATSTTAQLSSPAKVAGEKRRAELSAADVTAYIMAHPEWYEQVLSYTPLDLDKLHVAINSHFAAAGAPPSSVTAPLAVTAAGPGVANSPVPSPSKASPRKVSPGKASGAGVTVGGRVTKARLLEILDSEAVFVSVGQRNGKRGRY
jgi:hypothetical protein